MLSQPATRASEPAPAAGLAASQGPPTDESLARLAAAGDRASFDALADRYLDRILAFVRTRVRDTHDAEEAAQETFLRAWASLARFDPARRFSTWLFTIAHRQAIDAVRRRRRASRRPAHPKPQTAAAPSPHAGRVWPLARAVLSDDAFEAVHLTYVEGRSAAEIAAITGRSRVAVRVTLHRARERLRRELDAPDPQGDPP